METTFDYFLLCGAPHKIAICCDVSYVVMIHKTALSGR